LEGFPNDGIDTLKHALKPDISYRSELVQGKRLGGGGEFGKARGGISQKANLPKSNGARLDSNQE